MFVIANILMCLLIRLFDGDDTVHAISEKAAQTAGIPHPQDDDSRHSKEKVDTEHID